MGKMTSRELDIYAVRLARVVEEIGYHRLLALPKNIIKLLQDTTDVVVKVQMLERIACEIRTGNI